MRFPFPRTWVAALWLLMAASVAEAAPNPAIDLPAYIADLRNWSTAVEQLPAHPESAAAVRRSVPLKLEVETSGEHYAISNVWLVMALAQWEKRAPQRTALQQQMEQRLQWQQQQALALSHPSASPPPQLARAQLKAVLSGREFRFVQAPSWWDIIWARLRRWLSRWIGKMLNRLHLKPAVTNVLSWILLGSAFLLVALMLWRNLWRTSRGMMRLGLQAPVSPARGWRDWAEAARKAAAEEHYRDAVHCCYWAAVLRLEHLGVWRLDDSRTPREYLRLLPRDSQQRTIMASLTRSFEMVWYGYRPVTSVEAESALQELESLACSSPSIAATASY